MQAIPNFRAQKRGDMIVEEIKRWIAAAADTRRQAT